MNWKPIVAESYTPDTFTAYCKSLIWTAWRPSFIVLHNTGSPTLAQRPEGFTKIHLQNLERFYRDTQQWSAGPHLFIDDKQIWVFTPLTTSGVHSPSWNKLALGFEMLGDYSTESCTTGRGLAVRNNAVAAIATVCGVLGMAPTTLQLHKEDPKTTHACPGKNIVKSEIIAEVTQLLHARHAGEHSIH